MRKVKIGDVIEIRTRKGLAYAHYTHKHKQYGALLRVFDSIYDARPSNYTAVVRQRPAFSCFFPLSAAVNKKIVSIIGNSASSRHGTFQSQRRLLSAAGSGLCVSDQ